MTGRRWVDPEAVQEAADRIRSAMNNVRDGLCPGETNELLAQALRRLEGD